MKTYVGNLSGINVFQCDSVPIGYIYPTGKKDGNKLGKRKRNLKYSGCINYDDYILIHPSKANTLADYFA